MKTYYDSLREIHRILKPNTYVEIGIRNGESFTLAMPHTLCIGIDPKLDINHPINADSKLFGLTSDDFFNKYNLKTVLNEQLVDLAFIDGMHLFEYALRDFINLEKYCHKDSCIIVHDCLPIDKLTSQRDRITQIWTGDVWKLIPCLRKYRQDLVIYIINIPPSGLAIIKNLNPGSDILSKNAKSICDELIPLDFGYFEKHKNDDFSALDFSKVKLKDVQNIHRHNTVVSDIKNIISKSIIHRSKLPKCLGVLLCYNDADILPDVIDNMLDNNHDIIAWDHGSDDNTPEVLKKYKNKLIEWKFIPRSFDFYSLYPLMSRNLIDNYIKGYDWISWPDDDEILEGPDRKKTYYDYIREVFFSRFNYIKFNNYNYWFTEEDDQTLVSPSKRIRRYSIFPDCAPRIRSWRASVTNIREFNHNDLKGEKYPKDFNLRHYPIRTSSQMMNRINKDRAGLQRGNMNYHYNNMKDNIMALSIKPNQLHYDEAVSELNPNAIFNWRKIYGYPVQ